MAVIQQLCVYKWISCEVYKQVIGNYEDTKIV